jgi:hypothetical protein
MIHKETLTELTVCAHTKYMMAAATDTGLFLNRHKRNEYTNYTGKATAAVKGGEE